MKTKKIAYFIVILSLLLGANFSYGASEDTRYFVKSASGLWRKSLGARHVFGNGFTADLSAWQLKVAGMFGLEVEPVRKLYILPEAEAATLTQTSAKGRPVSRQAPGAQVQWGIKMIYNDSTLEKSSGGLDVNVAILDTGVLKTHPDLKNRIKDCKDFTSLKQPIVNGQCEDKNGHGTHVAGVIAADGGSDGLGVFGVAPAANLYAYQVCSASGSCWADDVAAAVRMAADNGANVVNISLGSDSPSLLIYDAVVYASGKNVFVVAAAGNDGPYAGSIDYPAANYEVVGVGALDVNKAVSDWSSRGVNSKTTAYVVEDSDIEFAAPGVSIESTWKDGGYAILSGTSMAAPHVSGLAAKLWQKDALAPADATRDLLHKFSADLLPLGDDDDSGWGIPP